MKAYCINLKRRPDRLKHITKECEKHDLEMVLIEASDGKIDFPDAPPRIWQAAYGCQLSHIKALELIFESGEDGLILEDDCQFDNDFKERFDKCFNELPNDFDVFFLGGSLLLENSSESYSDNLLRAKRVLCTHSYYVSRKAVKSLLNKAKEKQGKIDVIYTDFQQKNNCFISYPEIAWQRKGYSDLVDSITDNIHLRYGK